MFHPQSGSDPLVIGFLLVPRFTMMALFSIIEPMRIANRLAGRTLFQWQSYSLDGEPVAASNEMTILANCALGEVDFVPTLILCAGFEPQAVENRALFSQLRRLVRKGTCLGAVDCATHILAAGGFLDSGRVTMHWEAVPAFREDFPSIEVSGELFEVHGKTFTCAGGTAAIDMMLHLIATRWGHKLAADVSEQLIHDRIREPHNQQRMHIPARLGFANPRLERVVTSMEARLEDPLTTEELVRIAGVSGRQLERLFRKHLNETPTSHYLKLRLGRARHLLRQTNMSVMEVGIATGFGSASSLSRAYRSIFGRSPRQDRSEITSSSAKPPLRTAQA